MDNYNEIARKEMLTTYLIGLLKVLTRVKFKYLVITDVETNTEVYTINRINDEIKISDLTNFSKKSPTSKRSESGG